MWCASLLHVLVRFCGAPSGPLVNLQGASRARDLQRASRGTDPPPRCAPRGFRADRQPASRPGDAAPGPSPAPRARRDRRAASGLRVRRVAGGGAADGHARQHGRAAGHGPRRAQGAAAHAAPAPHRSRPLSSLLRSRKITPGPSVFGCKILCKFSKVLSHGCACSPSAFSHLPIPRVSDLIFRASHRLLVCPEARWRALSPLHNSIPV